MSTMPSSMHDAPDPLVQSGFAIRSGQLLGAGESIAGSLGWKHGSHAGKQESRSVSQKTRSICVSGACGFLGAWTLAECVRAGAETTVLCRDGTKLEASLTKFGLPPELSKQARVISSDIADFDEHDFPDAGAFIHCAGRVHGQAGISAMWRDNAACAAWACSAYAKRSVRVVHASTLSCFVSSDSKGLHKAEALSPGGASMIFGGYAHSKIVAEGALGAMGGISARLGLLTGSVLSGDFPPGTFFEAFVRGLARMGMLPSRRAKVYVDMTPVDKAAQALVHLALQAGEVGKIHHIANCQSIELGEIAETMGIEPVENSVFFEQLRKQPPMFRQLAHMAFDKEARLAKRMDRFNLDVFQSTGHDFDSEMEMGVSNKELVRLYLSKMDLVKK